MASHRLCREDNACFGGMVRVLHEVNLFGNALDSLRGLGNFQPRHACFRGEFHIGIRYEVGGREG
jgi:hypothetical protein